MDSAEQQVIDHLKQARNVLVTVRNNPTVDLLSACIGLALGLDKMDKHVAAVFSGEVPSTLEFLKPEETIEQNPDSLRDFIIALDKSKADKLRYKVEDKIVRIFITPYKTSLSQSDLEFSQGDFNVDAVIALGAHEQQELDQAITTHGRILHDATVMSINNTANGNLGSINWQDTSASSVSELVTLLIKDLNKAVLDEQIATALLTGIVAETARFSNEKTSPRTMSLAGDLMSAGANQQLVATQLEEESEPITAAQIDSGGTASGPSSSQNLNVELPKPDDGTLEINHQTQMESVQPVQTPVEPGILPEPPGISGVRGVPTDENPFSAELEKEDTEDLPPAGHSYLIDESTYSGNNPVVPSRTEPSNINPNEIPDKEPLVPLLTRDNQLDNPMMTDSPSLPSLSSVPPVMQTSDTTKPYSPAGPLTPTSDNETLEKIEEEVNSPHLKEEQATKDVDIDSARQGVLQALQSSKEPLKPLNALGANPLGDPLHPASDMVTPTPHTNEVEIDKDGNLTPKPVTPPVTPPSTIVPEIEKVPNGNAPLDYPSITPGHDQSALPEPHDTTDAPPPVPPPFMPPHNYTDPGQ